MQRRGRPRNARVAVPVTCPVPASDDLEILDDELEILDDKPGGKRVAMRFQQARDDDLEILDDNPRDPYGLTENPYAVPAPTARTERRRPCPECGEMILGGAKKCAYCGARLDDSDGSGKKNAQRTCQECADRSGLALGVLGVVANLVVASLYMTQGNPKGTKLLIMSICSNFYWLVALLVIRALPRSRGLQPDIEMRTCFPEVRQTRSSLTHPGGL